jgi:integrase
MRITTQASAQKAPPGRHNAGRGLYLMVSPDRQSRRWAFRYTKPSTRRVTELGLGNAALFTLAEVRDKVLDYRRDVAKGFDPVEAKREQRRLQITFAEMASAYVAVKCPGWRSESHYKTIRFLLNTYASSLATKHVSTITPNDVEAAVRLLWNRTPAQGKRALGAIRQVFDYAIAMGHRTANNPADWRIMKYRFPNGTRGSHYTAMDYANVPAFMKQLHRAQKRAWALSPCAIEFLILTACRANEVAKMRWEEIDWEQKVWTVPASRTKTAREHRVPLSHRALVLLKQQLQVSKGDYVWKSHKGRPIDGHALYVYLRRHMEVPVTIHGFRSSFRDWAGNETHFDRVTCELALAHKAGDATELAYRRSDALAKRRALMDAWAAYCDSGSTDFQEHGCPLLAAKGRVARPPGCPYQHSPNSGGKS